MTEDPLPDFPSYPTVLHVGRPNVGPREVFDQYVNRIFESNWLTNDGPVVREFEQAVADLIGVRW